MAVDPYVILEVERSASDVEIKAAYRRLVAMYHPDRNPGFQDAANEKLKALNDAYARVKAARGQGSHAPPPPSAAPRDDATGEHGRAKRRPHDEDPSAERAHLAAVATALARLGFLSAPDLDDPAVEIVASIVPGGTRIVVCVPYRGVVASGPYGFTEIRRSFLRPIASAGGPAARIVLCTADAMLWTTSRAAGADGVVVQEDVTAYSLAYAEILGARVTSPRKGKVDVWIDGGPTLTFRMAAQHAQALAAQIESAVTSFHSTAPAD